jgi:TolB-like protein
MSFDKRSTLIAVGGFGNIEVFSNLTHDVFQTIKIGKHEKVDSITYSPSGKYLSAGIKKENPEVRVWDVTSREPKVKCQLLGHTNRVYGDAIVFNYNEKYLATAAADLFSKEEDSAKRFEAIIWDLNSCQKVRTIQEFTAIGASSDGRFFVWDKDLNRMKTYFWGGTWINEITGKNMFTNVNELLSNLTDGLNESRRPTIAITDFVPIATNPSSFESFLSEEFITRMTLTRRFRVVERNLLDKVLAELKFSLSDLVDPNNAAKVGKLLGADYLLVGTVTDEKFGFKINARIINTETAEVLKAAATTVVKDPMVKNLKDNQS